MNVGKYYNQTIPGHHIGTKVGGYTDRDIKNALQKWKRKLKDSGRLDELRDKKEFIKPSARKREAKKNAIYFQAIEQRKMEE